MNVFHFIYTAPYHHVRAHETSQFDIHTAVPVTGGHVMENQQTKSFFDSSLV